MGSKRLYSILAWSAAASMLYSFLDSGLDGPYAQSQGLAPDQPKEFPHEFADTT